MDEQGAVVDKLAATMARLEAQDAELQDKVKREAAGAGGRRAGRRHELTCIRCASMAVHAWM